MSDSFENMLMCLHVYVYHYTQPSTTKCPFSVTIFSLRKMDPNRGKVHYNLKTQASQSTTEVRRLHFDPPQYKLSSPNRKLGPCGVKARNCGRGQCVRASNNCDHKGQPTIILELGSSVMAITIPPPITPS